VRLFDRQTSQVPPQLPLRIGHRAAQGAGPGDLVV